MTDLVEWLETAISELERLAWGACQPGVPTDAGPEAWRWFDTDPETPRLVGPEERGASLCSVQQYPVVSAPSVSIAHYVISFSHEAEVDVGVAAFLPFNDPAAALRRCAADRKILKLHRPVSRWPGDGCYAGCELDGGVAQHPCETLAALAEGYGYQEADHG